MATFLMQSDFKFGEISPLLFARTASPIYGNGAKRLRNVLVLPQGGVRRRFGLEFIADLTSIDSNYLHYFPFDFIHEDGSKYIVLFTPLKISIFHNDALVATVVSTYTATDILSLNVSQSNDLIFITCSGNGAVGKAPAILYRTSAHAGWTLNPSATFSHQPTYDFLQNYDTYSFTVVLVGTATVLTPATNLIGMNVTVHSSTAMFTANFEGGLYFGAGGTVRLVQYLGPSDMAGVVIKVFDEKSQMLDVAAAIRTIPGSISVVTEKVFSSTRGWPEKVSFFQNRLWFGKTYLLPGLLVGSSYNGFNNAALNFDDSRTLDTNGVSTVLYGRSFTSINHILSYKSLVVFTTSGVYSTSLDELVPVTPLNINFINLQTGDSSNNLAPDILENNAIFYDRGERRVKTLVVTDDGKNYQAGTLNLLAPHLIDQPYSSGVFDNSPDIDGSYLLVINNNGDVKGTLAVYNLIVEQGITAWTLQTTGSDPDTEGFRHVVTDGEDVYFITERVINGNAKLYLEKLNFDYLSDCTIPFTQASSTTITGLTVLEGLTVDVIAGTSDDDMGFCGSFVVTGGAVTISSPVTQGYVGLRVTPIVGTLPLLVPTEVGNNVFRPKLIKNLYVDFYESLSITVNDERLRYFDLNSQPMDTSLIPKTDFDEVSPMAGWNPRTEIVISQDAPNPFTIIGIGMNIEA